LRDFVARESDKKGGRGTAGSSRGERRITQEKKKALKRKRKFIRHFANPRLKRNTKGKKERQDKYQLNTPQEVKV